MKMRLLPQRIAEWKTYYAGTNTFTVEILPKPLTVYVDVGYTTGEKGEIDGAKINNLSYTGVLSGEEVTVTPTPSLVRDGDGNVIGVNVNFALGGAHAGNYVAEDMYVAIQNDMNSMIAELEKQIAVLEGMIGNVSDADLQTQIANINNSMAELIRAFGNANITDLAARLEALESAAGESHGDDNTNVTALYAIVWVLVAVVGAMLVGGVSYFIVSRKKHS